jgi:hypothetical protein
MNRVGLSPAKRFLNRSEKPRILQMAFLQMAYATPFLQMAFLQTGFCRWHFRPILQMAFFSISPYLYPLGYHLWKFLESNSQNSLKSPIFNKSIDKKSQEKVLKKSLVFFGNVVFTIPKSGKRIRSKQSKLLTENSDNFGRTRTHVP